METEDKEAIDAVLTKLQGLNPKQITKETNDILSKKNVVQRFIKFTELLNDCISETNLIVSGSFDERVNEGTKMYLHCVELWRASVIMFITENYNLATFNAIVCIEETAKVIVSSFKILFDKQINTALQQPKNGTQTKRKKDPLLKHPQKHILAVSSGLLVNSRADDKLGMDNIIKFLDMVESEKLEPFRQSCLYVDRKDGKLLIPREIHNRESASFYIALGGEILLSTYYFDNNTKFNDELNEFEKKHLLKSQE